MVISSAVRHEMLTIRHAMIVHKQSLNNKAVKAITKGNTQRGYTQRQ